MKSVLSAAVQVLAFVIIGIYVIWLAILSVMAFAEICRMSLHVRKPPAHRIVGFRQAPLTPMAVGVAAGIPLPPPSPKQFRAVFGLSLATIIISLLGLLLGAYSPFPVCDHCYMCAVAAEFC